MDYGKSVLRASRRQFLKTCMGGVGAGYLAARGIGRAAETQVKPPNIVLILTDDMDCRWMGCYGGKIPTPNIDALATAGMRFDRAYCAAAVCQASRFTVHTGLYESHCQQEKAASEEPVNMGWVGSVRSSSPTIAKMLSAAGYRTGFTGKWGVGFDPGVSLPKLDIPNADPEDPSYDRLLRQHQQQLIGAIQKQGGFTYAGGVYAGNLEGGVPKKLRHHCFEWQTQASVDFLDQAAKDGKPFFLMMAPTAVHGPDHTADLDANPLYTMGGKIEKVSPLHPPRSSIRERLEKAGIPISIHHMEGVGMLFLDDQVGAIVRRLRELQLEENTIVVLVSDNGVEPAKQTCQDFGVRLPMIVKWPGKVTPHTHTDVPVQYVDLLPTLVAAAEAQQTPGYVSDGVNLLPLLLEGKKPHRDSFYFEHGFARSVLMGPYKYIAFRLPQPLQKKMSQGAVKVALDQKGITDDYWMDLAVAFYPHFLEPDQLFDLSKDPNEQNNLFEDPAYAATRNTLQRELARYLQTMPYRFPLQDAGFLSTPQYRELVEKRKLQARQRQEKWQRDHNFRW